MLSWHHHSPYSDLHGCPFTSTASILHLPAFCLSCSSPCQQTPKSRKHFTPHLFIPFSLTTHRKATLNDLILPPEVKMVDLSALDDEVVALILEFDLLDLSRAERLSEDEVLRAVDLSLEMRAAKEAGSSSGQGSPPTAARFPAQDQPLPADRSPGERNRGLGLWARLVGSKTENQAGGSKTPTEKGDLISLEERNKLLAESEDEDDADGEDGGEPCAICAEGAGEKRRLACRCLYCAPCLRRCIRAGLRNEMNFPPRCHQRLTEEDIGWVKRPDLLRLYKQMATEWDTPAEERVYCSKPECSAFIRDKRKREGGEARCGVCGAGTCASCRRRWHPGLPCDERRENEDLMDMMDEHGYGHCTRCGTIVDSLGGCNHMT